MTKILSQNQMPRIGIWQHTRKTKREIPVHKIFSRKGILVVVTGVAHVEL